MREIALSGIRGAGLVALVDDDDYELVSKWAWSLFKQPRRRTGYAQASVHGVCGMKMHQFIMGTPPDSGLVIDHKNGNGLDNQRCNLRWVTNQQNSWNRHAKAKGSSRFIGVSLACGCVTRPWHAQISNGRGNQKVNLGYYRTEEEAAVAYDLAVVRSRGEFGTLNFPERSDEYRFATILEKIQTRC